MCEGDQILFQRISSVALRTTSARTLTGGGFRAFSARLADSPLLQWFCRLSQLQLYQEVVSESELREVVHRLMDSAAQDDSPLELEEALDLEARFLDSTSVELNIHYPTDWMLLRDAVRTLMKATILIRKRGLKVRMKEPGVFLKRMRRLSMEMRKQARRAGPRKGRRKTLRSTKRQGKSAAAHARWHRDLLEKRWLETDLSLGRARQILDRMDPILERLPYAVKQARERIIGERQVANEEKILDLYEEHAAVYVLGKAGEEVEFGSQLLLAEVDSGWITDWELVRGK